MTNINKVFVDVSSFFLFEATGDSEAEAGCFDPAGAMSVINHDEDDGDAESCSWDTTSDFIRELNRLEDRPNIVVGEDEEDDDGDRDGDGEVVDQKEPVCHLYKKCRDDDGLSKSKLEKKSSRSVSVDSTQTQTMNEMEKNKLFWEACLAS